MPKNVSTLSFVNKRNSAFHFLDFDIRDNHGLATAANFRQPNYWAIQNLYLIG
jgi:hypothetical protein